MSIVTIKKYPLQHWAMDRKVKSSFSAALAYLYLTQSVK